MKDQILKIAKDIEQDSKTEQPCNSQSVSCRFCYYLQMALPGESNVVDFEQTLFNDNRPQVELFCENAFTPEIFWNERTGNKPEIMLDEFSCRYFKSNVI